MSGVSDISCRALVSIGSSAALMVQELTHSAKNIAEITLDSIFQTFFTVFNALLFFFSNVPKLFSLFAQS